MQISNHKKKFTDTVFETKSSHKYTASNDALEKITVH